MGEIDPVVIDLIQYAQSAAKKEYLETKYFKSLSYEVTFLILLFTQLVKLAQVTPSLSFIKT